MSHGGWSSIRSILTAKDLKSFVEAYKIPDRFSPSLTGPSESAECTPDKIPIYTIAFSSCGVRYPISAFKISLLRHFGVHFSQIHPLGFMRVVHFELSCSAISGEPSVPLFCMFYRLISDGDWSTFAKRQNNISRPCYSFMPTSTYPKDWKSRFIFVSAAMLPESPLPKDLDAAIEDTGDSKDVKYVVDNEVDPRLNAEVQLVRKRRSASPQPAPAPRNIRQRLRSASGQKLPPSSKAASDLTPAGVKGSLSKHLRSSSLVSAPLLFQGAYRNSNCSSPSRIRDKASEVGVARFSSAFELSPSHATGTSKPTLLEGPVYRSPLAPLFADAIPPTYVPKWKVTSSSVIGTPEAARDFLNHAVPPSHKFVNSALRDDLFEDQYSMSLCESFFRGAGMLQRIDDLRKANEGLKAELKASQSVVAGLRGQVVDAERRLQEEKGAGAMLERKERAWEREMASLVEEKEELVAELKHLKEVGSVSQEQLNTMYADYGITSDDNQRLAGEKHWLITEGFGAFLAAVAQSEDFNSGLEEVYRAYRDVGY
ncbi:hypothetical protein HanXRQr2_Chr04g0149081 [Helianthus annuus]|uniref:Transposase (putative) gypsy type domain-containing protein n=1 Tax=Helianthus annuus TaxID=4232 RepID=A0A9K3NPY7_HELAN|nr:hypothetical protein HanXRQr2_Chr04g0149081 [Helianthus annuus]